MKIDAKSLPRAKTSSFSRAAHSQSIAEAILHRFFCKVCEPLKVLRLPAKTEVRPFALRVELLARCNLEKPLKSVPKSTRNRRKSRLGASRAPFSVDFGRSEGLGRATRGDSGGSSSDSRRPSRSKWVGRAPRSCAP